ncbi:VOC family protein [Burkholderia gladioli]|uniref:VOC family protein n=1 Tax=Burkholderia gladioli TaxID=28095 RepID=UPI00163F97F6|nr:VOC family protein [Burkholderia gladioli]
MFDHIGIVARDLKSSARLYAHMLAPLGIRLVEKHRLAVDSAWVVFSTGKPQSPFFVVAEGRPTFWDADARVAASPMHLSFSAPSRDAVDRFHAAGLAHGARDNGGPGIRRSPFYCAFLIDLDGNNVEAGCYLGDDEAAGLAPPLSA